MSTKKQTTKAKSLHSGDSATYVTRPKGKPSVTTKGKLNEWDNGYKEFIPQGQKPSNRTMLRQLGNSSFYRSEGEKLCRPRGRTSRAVPIPDRRGAEAAAETA